MSYINKHDTALVRVKLTDIGRERLAKGQLTFNSWVAGDSEVDYNYVKGWKEFVPNILPTPATGEFYFYDADDTLERNIFSKVLRPKDNQPFFTSFLLNQSSEFITSLDVSSSVQLLKGIVSNQAADRGFFSGSTVDTGLVEQTSSRFIKESGTIDLVAFSGGTDTTPFLQGVVTLDTPLTATTVNDFIMFRFSNSTLGDIIGPTMTAATVNQFYNITEINGNQINVDRALPNLEAFSGTVITYYTFPGGDDPIDNYYGLPSLAAYWNTGTLSFDSSCDVCVENIPVWNMNNVWSENLAGQFPGVDNYHGHDVFGSEQYMGTKQFLGYNNTPDIILPTNQQSIGYIDNFQKSISILHYTNSCISNFYGEMFYIDGDTDKLLNLDIPVLWHRRNDVGTGSGTTLGMRFVSDTYLKTISDDRPDLPDVEYYDLIEFSGMSVTPETPLAVGKVFPNLKIVVIDNEELVAAMSYKSNRNYTLPDLAGSLVECINGPCEGVLNPGESLFMTYWLDTTGTTTMNSVLPCQRYLVLDNKTGVQQDVQFRINNTNQLPYMRKLESPGYDGFGFSANKFYVLSQVVNKTISSRPAADQWRITDFTTTNITGAAGETINPISLSNQNPNINGFILDGATYSGSSIFNLGLELDLPSGTNYNKLTFGDERLFYGNLRTFIGATIYKSLFTINIDGATFGSSSNPTFTLGEDRFISEVGILDNNQNLVLVGKLSRPIRIADSSTAAIELTIDF